MPARAQDGYSRLHRIEAKLDRLAEALDRCMPATHAAVRRGRGSAGAGARGRWKGVFAGAASFVAESVRICT